MPLIPFPPPPEPPGPPLIGLAGGYAPPKPPPCDVIVEKIDGLPLPPTTEGDPAAPPAPTVTGYGLAVEIGNPVDVLNPPAPPPPP